MIRALVAAFMIMVVLLLSPISARSSNEQAAEIFLELMSPYCPGRSLQDCPSTKAAELKEEIRTMLSQGKSKQQIILELQGRFGEEILALPPARGVGIFAWALPIIFFIAGACVLIVWLRREVRAQDSPLGR